MQLYAVLQNILACVHVLELDVPPLTASARAHDLDSSTKSNGFRSLLAVLQAALQYIEVWCGAMPYRAVWWDAVGWGGVGRFVLRCG